MCARHSKAQVISCRDHESFRYKGLGSGGYAGVAEGAQMSAAPVVPWPHSRSGQPPGGMAAVGIVTRPDTRLGRSRPFVEV